jgi:predicted ATPase
MAAKGYEAPEVEQAYARARELCQQGGEPSQLFLALSGLWQYYLVRAQYQAARELGAQLLELAQRIHDPALLLSAHRALAEPLFLLGELPPARTHLEQSIALYNPQQHRTLAFLYGLDPGVMCLNFAALTLWHLGYPEQALTRSQEAISLAQELLHPLSLAAALCIAANVHQFRGERQWVRERAEAAVLLTSEQGFPHWLAYGTFLRGWALAEEGQVEEGLVQMRRGLAAWQATGVEVQRSYFFSLWAAVQGKEGQAKEGLTLLTEALAIVDKNGERWCEAELYQLKGTLTLQSNLQSSRSQGEAERYWHKAIKIARQQHAKSPELRAATSLSRLWQHQGKKAEAHRMLSEIYGWFTEGFDTKDLQEAKAFLDELS